MHTEPVTIVILYADSDEEGRDSLEEHLSVLSRTGIVRLWHKGRILAGDEQSLVTRQILSAFVVVFLVSSSFLASDEQTQEMNIAMKRYHDGCVRVIPVIWRPCFWRIAPFASARLKPLPNENEPIATSRNRDEAWTRVVEGIVAAINVKLPGEADVVPSSGVFAQGVERIQEMSRTELPRILAGINTDPRAVLIRAGVKVQDLGTGDSLDRWTIVCDQLASRGVRGIVELVKVVHEIQDVALSAMVSRWFARSIAVGVEDLANAEHADATLISILRAFAQRESERWRHVYQEFDRLDSTHSFKRHLTEASASQVRACFVGLIDVWRICCDVIGGDPGRMPNVDMASAVDALSLPDDPCRNDVDVVLAELRPYLWARPVQSIISEHPRLCAVLRQVEVVRDVCRSARSLLCNLVTVEMWPREAIDSVVDNIGRLRDGVATLPSAGYSDEGDLDVDVDFLSQFVIDFGEHCWKQDVVDILRLLERVFVRLDGIELRINGRLNTLTLMSND